MSARYMCDIRARCFVSLTIRITIRMWENCFMPVVVKKFSSSKCKKTQSRWRTTCAICAKANPDTWPCLCWRMRRTIVLSFSLCIVLFPSGNVNAFTQVSGLSVSWTFQTFVRMGSNNANYQKSHVRSCTAAICDVASFETQRYYNRIGVRGSRTMLGYPTVFFVPYLRLIQNTQDTSSLSMTATDLVCVSSRQHLCDPSLQRLILCKGVAASDQLNMSIQHQPWQVAASLMLLDLNYDVIVHMLVCLAS